MKVVALEQVPTATQYLIEQVGRLEAIIQKLVESNNNQAAPVVVEEPPEKLYTRAETAAMLKISLVTLNEWTKSGYIECVKAGARRIYYTKATIDKSLKKKVIDQDTFTPHNFNPYPELGRI